MTGPIAALNEKIDPAARFLRRKSTSYAISLAFAAVGVALMALDMEVPQWYVAVLLFAAFKIAVNYKKCTISYIECKLRGVKRERGLLSSLLDGIVDLRDEGYWVALTLVFTALVCGYYFGVKGRYIVL